MTKPRIGMILDQQFPPDPRVENEAVSLADAGFEVFLWAYSFDNRDLEERYKNFNIYRTPASKYWIKKLRALVNTLPLYNYFLINKLKIFIDKYKIDVLHVHDLYLLGAALSLKQKFDLPIVSDLHENYVEGLKKYRFSTTFPGNMLISIPRWEKTEKKWLSKVDKIIVVIEEAVERLVRLGIQREKIGIVPNYVNIEQFTAFGLDPTLMNKFKDKYLISYTGAFDFHRGLDTLIHAFKICTDKGFNGNLLLVGSGQNQKKLVQFVNKLELGKSVIFEGYQPFRKFPSYIQISDIGVIPHIKTIHTDNTVPHKLFHYMLMKKPVIVSNCAPLERIVNECKCGFVFESENSNDLAEKILKIYNNKNQSLEMGINGEKCANAKFNWSNSANQLVKFYENFSG
jgi:glycosyltransferase involved in cell wall biosynthesis